MTEKERIEKIMHVEQLTSAQFAAEIGIQTSTLSHILNGRNNPSLDVLKKILNRYPQISSDWLILGFGTIFREELKSQSLSLFDNIDINTNESNDYVGKMTNNTVSENSGIQNEMLKNKEIRPLSIKGNEAAEIPRFEAEIKELKNTQPDKSVKKIILYYTDNTFQEFESK